ncbi:hypothetical protein HYX04_01215 [Candidatus Woesearchaeota archaeon]|nr:hypothetical protein [Candidatus Woesearchaeota archaeon]
MYKAKLWDEDKWNIHSGSYNSPKYSSSPGGKKDDKKYNEQKYGQKEGNVSSDYIRKQDEKEKEDKDKTNIFEDFEEESNASERTRSQLTENPEIKDEEMPFKAAKQIFNESKYGAKKTEKSKNASTIEDAIKKAIEEEKKVIIMDS